MISSACIYSELRTGCPYYLKEPIRTKELTGTYPKVYMITKETVIKDNITLWVMDKSYRDLTNWFKEKQTMSGKPEAFKQFINCRDSSWF